MLRRTPDWRSWCSSLMVASILISCLQDQVFAQITPDNTLLNNSSVARDGNIFNITGGTQAGSNLFHSFREFSVPPGGTASFNNAGDIQNIISRVTGGSVSNIDGLIRAYGKAHLFLINPSGIIFGEGARLDIGGSFVGTTASAIGFGDRGFFSTTNPNTPQLLTVNPSAFLFNQTAAAPIKNNSIASAGKNPAGFDAFGLRVPDGKSLLLVGGNVSMNGGRLNAYGGRVELGGLSEPGTVLLGIDGDNLSLRFPDNVARARIYLINNAGVTVEAAGGGSIAVNASTLEILEGSFLNAGSEYDLGTPETVAGDITLNATRRITVASSVVFNDVGLGSRGNGGNITIDSNSLELKDGAQLATSTSGQGNAGAIKVNTNSLIISGSSLDLNSNSGLFVNSQSPTGTAGDIIVTSRTVILNNRGTLNAQSILGNGGDINLQTNLLLLRRGAEITATAGTPQSGGGNGGNITINAPNGFIVAVPSENNDITANAFIGKAGKINITASGIFGIQYRQNRTSQSDITASSEFRIHPNIIGFIGLPTTPVDTKVAQGCYSPGYAQNRFVIAGRGGLPPNPKDILTPDAPQIDWVSVKPTNKKRSIPPVTTNPTTSTPKRIVEATGATLNAKGQIVLSANSSAAPYTFRHNPIQCHGS